MPNSTFAGMNRSLAAIKKEAIAKFQWTCRWVQQAVRPALTVAAAVFTWVLSMPSHAMEISVHGDRMVASGELDLTDEPRMAIALGQAKITEIVLLNVSGADYRIGFAIAALIEQKRLPTTVIGQCSQACSVVFLAGKARRFADGEHPRKTSLLLQPPPESAGALRVRYLQQLRQQLPVGAPRDALVTALEALQASGASVRLREPGRNSPKDALALACTGQGLAESCRALDGVTAVTTGFVTDASTLQWSLPPGLLAVATVFGVPLAADTPAFEQTLQAQGVAMCAQDAVCVERWRTAIPRLQVQKINRAAALGISSKGFGFSDDQETPDSAAKRAVFLCNHTPGNKKLCKLASVNNFDASDLYRRSADAASTAIVAINAPLAREAWADEDKSALPGAESALRTSQLNAATPLDISGLTRWQTGALARAVASRKLVLVDVHGVAGEMLPGAVHFWDGGLAFESPSAESEYDQRFRDMLALVAADKNTPVVFYCRDSECWTSINAALRARKAGYAQAGWYRGGLRSWSAAGLPLVQKTPSAVLN